ncbi:MAG: efflux RND transporter periplasmic adaptor subunit [Pseudomonadota bacterium]
MTSLLRSPWTLSIIIVLVLVAWMTSGALSDGSASSSTPVAEAGDGGVGAREGRLTRVQYQEEFAQRIERRLQVSGRTEASREVQVKAQTSGRIEATVALRGARMEAGEEVLRLDLSDRQARLTQAKALVRQRELEYASNKALKPSGFNTEGRVAETLANLEGARAELRRAELDLERMVVRAPFDGALQDRSVEVGDYVTPGDPLFTYLDDRKVIVSADVSEGDIGYLHTGLVGEAQLIDGVSRQGHVRYISPQADTSTRTFLVELELDNAQGRLPLGASADLGLPLESVLAHAISPALMTLDDAGGLGIKIVDDDNQVRFLPVEIARADGDTVWVTGLPDPARIITVGYGFVSEGERVAPTLESQNQRTARERDALPDTRLVEADVGEDN